MQLVINIDDKLYEIIKNPKKLETMYHAGRLCEAVRNGTRLPKGHGRLIDADEFKNYCQTGLENVKPLFKTEKYCKLAIDITQGVIADVDEMKTIIEADKAESEG